MNKLSLRQLYRAQSQRPTLSARALIDATTAVRAASGKVVPHEREEIADALAGSAAHADLVRMLRALQPDAAQLAHALAQHAPGHEQRERPARRAHARRNDQRGWQWGALAAVFVAAVALFAARSSVHGLGDQSALAQMPQATTGDSIFGAPMELRMAMQSLSSDVIFRPDIGRSDDRIFRGHLGGG